MIIGVRVYEDNAGYLFIALEDENGEIRVYGGFEKYARGSAYNVLSESRLEDLWLDGYQNDYDEQDLGEPIYENGTVYVNSMSSAGIRFFGIKF